VKLRKVSSGYWRLGDSDVTIGRTGRGQWKVSSALLATADWEADNGLLGVTFPTLNAAARALNAAVEVSGPPPASELLLARLRRAGVGGYVAGENGSFTVQRTVRGWLVDHAGARIAWCRTLYEVQRRIGPLIG